MKMYIAVLDEFPDYMAPTLVAHSVLAAHIRWSCYLDDPENTRFVLYKQWIHTSFKKCVVRVNQKEFDRIANLDDVYIGHENKTLDGKDTCVVVCPRQDVPNVLKFAKLWKPKNET